MYSNKQKGGVFGIYTVPKKFSLPLIKDLDPNEIRNQNKLVSLSKKGININIRSARDKNLIGREINGISNNDIHIHPSKDKSDSISMYENWTISMYENWIASFEQNVNLQSKILGDIDVKPHLEYTETYYPDTKKCKMTYQYWLGPVYHGKRSPFSKNKPNHKISYEIIVQEHIPDGEVLMKSGNLLNIEEVALSINLQKKRGEVFIPNGKKLPTDPDFVNNAYNIFNCYINLTNVINQFMNERLRNQTLFSVDQHTQQSVEAAVASNFYAPSSKTPVNKIHSKKKRRSRHGGASLASSTHLDNEESAPSISVSLCIPKNITLLDYFDKKSEEVITMVTSEQISISKKEMSDYLINYNHFGEGGLTKNLIKKKKKPNEIEIILSMVKEEYESKSSKPKAKAKFFSRELPPSETGGGYKGISGVQKKTAKKKSSKITKKIGGRKTKKNKQKEGGKNKKKKKRRNWIYFKFN